MRNKMTFIYDAQIDMPYFLVPDRLDTGKGDRFSELLPADPGREDPQRGIRPMESQLPGILLDELFHMGEHQYPGLRPVLDRILTELCNDMTFPSPGGQHQAGMSFMSLKPTVEIFECFLLVIS